MTVSEFITVLSRLPQERDIVFMAIDNVMDCVVPCDGVEVDDLSDEGFCDPTICISTPRKNGTNPTVGISVILNCTPTKALSRKLHKLAQAIDKDRRVAGEHEA